MRGFIGIGLVAPKNEHNVGGVLRAAHCFGASLLLLQAPRYRHGATNVSHAERHITMIVGDICDLRPYNCPIVVVDIVDGARPLPTFHHPERALYVFGPEDGSVPKDIIDRAQHVVSIPSRFCLNLAAAANVVLYDRAAKYERFERGVRSPRRSEALAS